MRNIIKVKNIEKTYSKFLRPVKALKGISFELKKGVSVGLVGPNGAGKSTLIKIMVGVLNADKGEVHIKTSKPIGYVEEEPNFLDTTVFKNIKYIGELTGVPLEKINKYLKYFDLYSKKNNLPSELSHGQKKRLALLRALIYDPEIMILDEPFSGLDPSISLWMKKEILNLKRKKVTMFISSHNLSYLLPLVDTVLFIKNGKIIYTYNPSEKILIKVIFKGNLPKNIEVEEISKNKALFKIEKEKIPELVENLIENNVKIYEVSPAGLEEIYEKIYGG